MICSGEQSNNEDHYYACRAEFNQLILAGEWQTSRCAELFYYLNRTGYNGLCRFNRAGLFNVPFGRYKSINYITDFTHYSSPMKDWTLSYGDFGQMKIPPNSIIYADPPYDVEFVNYSPGGFDWGEQVRLVCWLARQSVPIIASNQATSRIIELYRDNGFTIELLQAPRRISCTGDREQAQEMLATKGLPAWNTLGLASDLALPKSLKVMPNGVVNGVTQAPASLDELAQPCSR